MVPVNLPRPKDIGVRHTKAIGHVTARLRELLGGVDRSLGQPMVSNPRPRQPGGTRRGPSSCALGQAFSLAAE